jgi:sugar phosphate isomerase/epimerase
MVPALKAQRTMLRDYGVILAIETHFEFTSFELLRLLDMCDAEPGDYLGICLDTLNLLTMLEDPLSAAKRLLPWVVSTHIKDGVLALDSDGMRSYPVTPGHGIVDLEGILHLLNQLERPVFLSLEDHAGSIAIPVFDPLFISKFPDLSASELARIVSLALRGNSLEKAKKTGPLSRDAWPEHCEERIRLGIQALRSLTGPLENQGVSHDSA